MCSGNAFAPRNWNHDLHNLAGCDHDSIQARILDAFMEDFMVHHHYNRYVEHFDNEAAANARRDLLNNAPLFTADPTIEPADNRHIHIDFAKGGYLTGQPQTTFGGIPVAPPIDLPPPQVKPRVRGLASLRRSWRVR